MPEKAKDTSDDKQEQSTGCCGRYPPSVFFIVGNEFCERFSFYGMKAILVIFFTTWIEWPEHTATSVYHTFTMLCYFFPLLGAILADGLLGKYKTIIYLSVVYCAGHIIKSATSIPQIRPDPYGSIIGLLLIAIGTGGIKPCVAAFGGDQFTKGQEAGLGTFFAMFYFSINAGSALSTFLTPIFRSKVKCFGGDCYPLAFGVPAGLMIIATLIIVAGRKMYVMNPPGNNVIGRTIMATGRALCNRKGKKDHWLDHANDKYDQRFLDDLKPVFRVLIMFIPLPVFWALFDQQGSRWTLQAQKMDGSLGSWTLEPDQIQTINPLFIMVLIPIFEKVIYPLLDKCKIPNRPLQRMGMGMIFAAGAFVIAGFIQLRLNAESYNPVPSHVIRAKFTNTLSCTLDVESDMISPLDKFTLGSMTRMSEVEMSAGVYDFKLECSGRRRNVQVAVNQTGVNYQLIAYSNPITGALELTAVEDARERQQSGKSGIYIWAGGLNQNFLDTLDVEIEDGNNPVTFTNLTNTERSDILEVTPGSRGVSVASGKYSTKIDVKSGGVYMLLLHSDSNNKVSSKLFWEVSPNELNMLWQIPQYFVMTAGEIMFSITGLSFAYSQSPGSMKSVLQAAWLLTVAFGNVIVAIIAEAQFFSDQAHEFFFFAGLMGVVTIIFALMSCWYKYAEFKEDVSVDDDMHKPTQVSYGKELEARENKGYIKDEKLEEEDTSNTRL